VKARSRAARERAMRNVLRELEHLQALVGALRWQWLRGRWLAGSEVRALAVCRRLERAVEVMGRWVRWVARV